MFSRTCKYKRQYKTKEEASRVGCIVYLCQYCNCYHRATDRNYVEKRRKKYKGGYYKIVRGVASIWSDYNDFKKGMAPELNINVKNIDQAEEYLERLQEGEFDGHDD